MRNHGGMNACFEFASSVGAPNILVALSMSPPLVPVPALVGTLVASCVALFLVRSHGSMKQQYLDRIYGPGVKQRKLEWWETDLDPIFKEAVCSLAAKWRTKQNSVWM